MTNKQVIDILRIIRYRYENDEDGVEFRYALDLAIKALKREENLEQAVVADYIAGYEVGCSEGMEFQKKQRPQGKWIPQTAYDGFTYWKCSECGKKNDYAITKFCWHCGADMRKETEE